MEQLGRVVELDSDMADVTQEPPPESVMEDAMAEEQDTVPASTHIASTLGINPHVLQVSVMPLALTEGPWRYLWQAAGFAFPGGFTEQLVTTPSHLSSS